LLVCFIEGAWSWSSLTKGVQPREDLITVAFLLFAIFISASIAYTTVFWRDRMVFGAAAGAFALDALRAAPLPTAARLPVDVAHALMWTVAAAASLMALASGSVASRGKN
jgi:hypothetical protein